MYEELTPLEQKINYYRDAYGNPSLKSLAKIGIDRKETGLARWAVERLAQEHDTRERAHREALFMCASHCQGGHSNAGAAAAEVLGIPFPITMDALVEKAESEGFDPNELWPWFMRQRRKRAPSGESP